MLTGDDLRRTRKELGMNQEQLAFALGYSRAASISDIEKGKKTLTTQAMILLSLMSDRVTLTVLRNEKL